MFATLVNVFTVEPENPHIKPIMEIAKFDAHLYEVVDSLP